MDAQLEQILLQQAASAIKQGDKAGLVLFDRRIRSHIPTGGTVRHLYNMLSALELTKPGGHTSAAAALRKAFTLFKQRGVLIIISDLLDEPDERLRRAGVMTSREVLHGEPGLAIAGAVHPGDLIVMTSRGRSGITRMARGSVAEKLIREGPVPILLVPAAE